MMIEQHVTGSSRRITKTAEIYVNGGIDKVFPLFTPLEELKWVEGWKPRFIYPADGTAEEQMIFVTPSRFEGEDPYRWVLSKLDRRTHHVEYVVFAKDRVWNICVTCLANGNITRATITYRFTSLTDRGHALNDAALRQMYQRELKDWEEAINEYLIKQN